MNGSLSSSNPRHKPLAGIRVLDFTHVLAGPYCTMLLGDLGAEILKIEPPAGDSTRHQGPPFHNGQGLTWLTANRNKSSLVLDLRKPEDLRRARELAAQADVIVENFRQGVMARFGLDYESLSTANPRLIYCSLSGFGSDGPYRDKGAFDLTIQAIGGYMSITGERGGAPVKLGTSVFDLVAGQNAALGILSAIIERQQSGMGQRVETSLLEGEIAFLVNAGLQYLLTGTEPSRYGSEHPQAVPYKAFKTADGWVAIAAALQSIYPNFVNALGRPDLATDNRFARPDTRVENRDELYRILDQEVARWTTSDLVAVLESAGVACAPVKSVGEALDDPQVRHRGMVQNLEHAVYGKISLLGSAIKMSAAELNDDWTPPPLLGEGGHDLEARWLDRPLTSPEPGDTHDRRRT